MTEQKSDFGGIYDELKPHTMIAKDRFVANLRCADWVQKQPNFPDGSIVECGVWRGGMAAGFMKIFGRGRRYILFDSFEGLPPPNENDGEDARWWQEHPEHPRYFDNCTADLSDVEQLLNSADSQFNIRIVKGWFSETLPKTSLESIAFVHLDCDWYDSYTQCLQRLWPHIRPGGAIIIDDYFDWEGCRRAVHDFLSRAQARETIERVGSTGGAFIRRRGPWDLLESQHLG